MNSIQEIEEFILKHFPEMADYIHELNWTSSKEGHHFSYHRGKIPEELIQKVREAVHRLQN